MKIAIVSDTHGDIADLVLALHAMKPDRFIHLGDYESDARAIARETKLPYDAVGGNCDGSRERGKLLTIDGKKIFLTHGHLFGVKMNLTRLYYHALEIGADVVFFGHTQTVSRELGRDFILQSRKRLAPRLRGRHFCTVGRRRDYVFACEKSLTRTRTIAILFKRWITWFYHVRV